VRTQTDFVTYNRLAPSTLPASGWIVWKVCLTLQGPSLFFFLDSFPSLMMGYLLNRTPVITTRKPAPEDRRLLNATGAKNGLRDARGLLNPPNLLSYASPGVRVVDGFADCCNGAVYRGRNLRRILYDVAP
jgi:hypothetical protein